MLANRLPASRDAVAFGFAVTRLPLRGQRRVWFSSSKNTHRLPVSLAVVLGNTKINSKAPDNFGSDAICSHGNWQAGGRVRS